jgi:DNA-binding NtrC family response regulator
MSVFDNRPKRARVLVLEDHADFRGLLVELLGGEGFDVATCDSYASLCDAVRAFSNAVVVADFWGTSHTELSPAERAQIRDLGSHVPTILLTARAWAVAVNAEELNVACILSKPVSLEDVVSQVVRCVTLVPE